MMDAASRAGLPAAVLPALVAGFGYALAALAFLALSLLLLRRWRDRQAARALGLACLLTACWAGGIVMALLWPQSASRWPQAALLWVPALDTLRCSAWLVFLLLLLEPAGWCRKFLFIGLGLMLVGQFLIGRSGAGQSAWPGVLHLLLALSGMLLVEQWYRATPPAHRWGIKFACIGIGTLFAYDFYLVSDTLLLRRVDADLWAARGLVHALTVPLLAVSAARNGAWSTGLTLSRQLVFRSAALLGAAIYLLTMAVSAYYIRCSNGAWGPVMQLAYLVGAMLLLAGALFSGALRARLKVLINKHFYGAMFDYRHEWLRLTRVLSEDGPALGERTIEAVAQLVHSPAGALWVSRESGLCEPAASWNMPRQAALETAGGPLCRFLESRQWVVDIADCRARPALYGRLAMPDWLLALPQAWLLVPLMLHGRLFGFVLLARPLTRIGLDWEVTDLLKIAGSQAASYLAHRESADSLAVARQFDAFNRMSTFIVHDLKNLLSQLSLLLGNAEKHKANPAFQEDMQATLAHSVAKMAALLQKLSRNDAGETAAPVAIASLLADAVAAKRAAEPAPLLDIRDAGLSVLANRGRLERVLGHLIQNAIEATAKDGRVTVRLLREAGMAAVEIDDSGAGMSADFIHERLFKPFDTTKAAGMGIGVFESREYIRQVGGRLEVFSRPAAGSVFRVILPLHGDAACCAS
jgi:putative PEP-CTERM system histidine kinase